MGTSKKLLPINNPFCNDFKLYWNYWNQHWYFLMNHNYHIPLNKNSWTILPQLLNCRHIHIILGLKVSFLGHCPFLEVFDSYKNVFVNCQLNFTYISIRIQCVRKNGETMWVRLVVNVLIQLQLVYTYFVVVAIILVI